MRNWILNWTSFSRDSLKESLNKFALDLMAALVAFYRTNLKWFVVGDCKYHPTCSEYALEVIKKENAPRAFSLIVKRLLRCHPWSEGGLDPHVH